MELVAALDGPLSTPGFNAKEEPLIVDLLALLSADASPARRAARDERRSRALRSLLSDREFEALPDELLDLLFGDRLVLWKIGRAHV